MQKACLLGTLERQDMALGNNDISLDRLSDRGLLIAWASDQMLPQNHAVLFTKPEAKTNIRDERNLMQKALVAIAHVRLGLCLPGHML